MIKEIHFYESYDSIPRYIEYTSGWRETERCIKYDDEIVCTSQMGLLSTRLFELGYKIFIHENRLSMYEIKLGNDNERTDREIKLGHDLFKLWRNGEFDRRESD